MLILPKLKNKTEKERIEARAKYGVSASANPLLNLLHRLEIEPHNYVFHVDEHRKMCHLGKKTAHFRKGALSTLATCSAH